MYERLVEALRNMDVSDACPCSVGNMCDDQDCIVCQAADAIEELSRRCEQFMYTPPPAWIPVTERLPKDGVFVLVCNDDGHMMIAKYESETYEWYYKYTNYDFDIWDNEEQGPVCYWMPLPEPPKEVVNGEITKEEASEQYNNAYADEYCNAHPFL